MAKSGFEFKVRLWAEKSNDRPYDVVCLDYDNNNQHYQPHNVNFSTVALAQKHADSLTKRANECSDCINFIRDHWPVDGGIDYDADPAVIGE